MSKVAIGIPVYNGEKWLAGTIQSVLEQSFSDFSVTICDNASTDRTQEIVSELARNDTRIRYHKNPKNIGVFRNLDLVFELSASPYFKWCAVGDGLHPDFLKSAVDVLDSQLDATLVYSRTRLVGSLSKLPDIQDVDLELGSSDPVCRYKEYFNRTRLNSPFHGLIRSEALSNTGLNRPFRGSDQCLIGALLLQGRFVRLDEELLYRRIERSTATATKSTEELNEFYSVDGRTVNRFPTWKFEKQLFGDVFRARVKYKYKLPLLLFLLRGLNWQRHKLIQEVASFFTPANWRR